MAEETRQLDPEEAFSLVAEEKRFAIVEALWEAEDGSLSFSALREAVGIRDSGQFNYHLDKLTGSFVRKTDDGEYALRHAGARVVGSILSGGYTRAATVDPIPVDGDCPECGGGLVAGYEEETARIECDDCGLALVSFDVPPGILDGYDRERYPAVFDRWIKSTLFETLSGFCWLCTGRLHPTVTELDDESGPAGAGSLFDVEFTCERCGDTSHSALGATALDHPALISFAHDHGIDVWRTPVWKLDWLVTAEASVVAEDPLRARVTYDLDGERLELTVDDDLAVVSAERSRPNA